MNHKPSVRSLFSGHRAASVSTAAKRTSSISNAIRTASVGGAFVGNSKFHVALTNSNDTPTGGETANQNIRPSENSNENANAVKKTPLFSRRSPFLSRKSKDNANLAMDTAPVKSPLSKEPSSDVEDMRFASVSECESDVTESPSPKDEAKSEDRLTMSELFTVYSRITRRRLSKQEGTRAGLGTWGYRGATTKPRPSLIESDSPFRTLPRNCANPTLLEDMSDSPTDDVALMSLAYAKLLKLRKQKEELKRIHHMLDDLENDFMGSKENSTYIERYMEVKVKKDYMLSPGNPESTVEKEDTIKVFGYMGHNTWRIMGPHCKGYCKKNTVLNPRVRSQNLVQDVDIVCNACNKITVPLIGSVPTSILHMRNANHHSPG